jgi:serine/threonine protein kinase
MMTEGSDYTEKVDVWSFGMVLYELTTNTIPYDYCMNPTQIYQVRVKKKLPSFPEGIEIHSTLRQLMEQCWN